MHLCQRDERSAYGTGFDPDGGVSIIYRSLSSIEKVTPTNQCQMALQIVYPIAASQGTKKASNMVSISWTTLIIQKACERHNGKSQYSLKYEGKNAELKESYRNYL